MKCAGADMMVLSVYGGTATGKGVHGNEFYLYVYFVFQITKSYYNKLIFLLRNKKPKTYSILSRVVRHQNVNVEHLNEFITIKQPP